MASNHTATVRRIGAVAAIALLALSGCSQADKGSDAGRSNSPSRTADGQCALLTADEVESLTGEKLEPRATTISGSTIPACQYGELSSTGIQVNKGSADVWARALPGFVEQIKASGAFGSDEVLAQLERAADAVEQGKTLPPGEACEFFSTLIELQDQPPNTHSITTYLPTADKPFAISSQSCHGDTYASLLVSRPGITRGGGLESLVGQQLDALSPPQD